MTPEGQLKIDLYLSSNGRQSPLQVKRAEISALRPLHLSRLFEGKTPQQVLAMIPLIFSVCSKAQSAAAAQALAKAQVIQINKSISAAHNLIVLGEMAREHVLRICLDWERFASPPDEDQPDLSSIDGLKSITAIADNLQDQLFEGESSFASNSELAGNPQAINQKIDELQTFLQDQIYGEDLASWSKRLTETDLTEWAQNQATCNHVAAKTIAFLMTNKWNACGAVPCVFLPHLDQSLLRQKMTAPRPNHFLSKPEWSGKFCETSALSRMHEKPLLKDIISQYGCGLMARLVARLLELAELPSRMRSALAQVTNYEGQVKAQNGQDSSELNQGGLSIIEAARGRLIHYAEISHGIVSKFRILAPTEWNFHPQGVVEKSLTSLSGKTHKEIVTKAHLLVSAIDPCVGYKLRVM